MLYKFIGNEDECGFINGQIYDLELYKEMVNVSKSVLLEYKQMIMAYSKHKKIPYSNMELFNKNWEKIIEK